jgi:hypothetical protein
MGARKLGGDLLVGPGGIDLGGEHAGEHDESLPLEVEAVGLVRAAERAVEHVAGRRRSRHRVGGGFRSIQSM